ncbi:MAG TPA: hypothetical protein VMC62_03575 [Longilinea sp.]|nr:hypothetical protein [Longilinea sp.]
MEEKQKRPVRWPRWVLIAGLLWGQFALATGTFKNPTPNNLTTFTAIEAAGFYTLILFLTRRWWLPLLSRHPVSSAAILSIFNAALIEAEFWAFERLFGGSGIAASSNLLLDWLLTMPWYIGMVLIFVRGQNRSRFPAITLFFLCGLYELGADGIVGGQLLPWISGNGVPLPSTWAFLVFIAFWEFILVYSSMILPPAWVIAAALPTNPSPARRWQDALLPLAWLFPYTIYLLLMLILLGHR